MIAALIVAPCVIVHASYSPSSHAPETVASAVHEMASHHHGSAPGTAPTNSHSHSGTHDHDQDDDHNCPQNCNGWLSSNSSGANSRAILQLVDIDPPILLSAFTTSGNQVPADLRKGDRSLVTDDNVLVTLTVLERTARLRI